MTTETETETYSTRRHLDELGFQLDRIESRCDAILETPLASKVLVVLALGLLAWRFFPHLVELFDRPVVPASPRVLDPLPDDDEDEPLGSAVPAPRGPDEPLLEDTVVLSATEPGS